ncbi:MAG: YdeI/OmpD-associated family protein [Chitinophagaceae bacterium]|nr:YdeI/OmpD-associated family protein [Chitinophagaceae bacterium]
MKNSRQREDGPMHRFRKYQSKHNPFGWVKVKGMIADYEIRQYHLMPIGNGKLFLPVKAEIRKKIKKEAGDWVKVVLFEDHDALEIPGELLECLRYEPAAHLFFFTLSDSEKKFYINWIYSAKGAETKIKRLAETVNRLANKLKIYDKIP